MKRPGIILGLVSVAVVGLAVAHFAGIFPPKSGFEGTIGAAKRYNATQITDKDVVLQDPQVQALLQSDLFHKVIATPEFRKLAQTDQFWHLVTTADFQKLVVLPDADGRSRVVVPDADGRSRVVLPDADGLRKFGKDHPEFNKLITNRDFLNLVQNANFLQLVGNDQFQKLAGISDVQKVVSEASGE